MSSRSLIATLIGAVLISACGSTTSGGGAAVAPPPASDLRTAGTLTVGSDIEYPPQEYFNPPGSNTAVGFDIDVGKALAAKMGLGFTATNDKFAAIFADLTGKKFDIVISATTITDERKKSFDFVPYFNAGESFVVPKTSSVHPTKIADLCGLTVAVEKGTTEESESMDANTKAKNGPCTSKPIVLSSFDTDTEALQQLAPKGAVKVHFTDSPVAGYELKQNSSLAVSGSVIEVAPEGIVVRKGDSAMLKAMQDAFKAIETDGTYDNLLSKWGVKDGDIRKASTS